MLVFASHETTNSQSCGCSFLEPLLSFLFLQEIRGGCDHLEPGFVRTHPLRGGPGHTHAPHVPSGESVDHAALLIYFSVIRDKLKCVRSQHLRISRTILYFIFSKFVCIIALPIMFLQPWTPTKAFPHPLSCLSYQQGWSAENYLSYQVLAQFLF